MRASSLDHLVVVAPTLAAGALYIAQRLGLEMQPGGQHPRMGTHNLLLRLGDAYLEVIAPAPDAAPPARPRWFGLDDLGPQTSPYLAHWVVRTQGLERADDGLTQTFGAIERMSRGTLSWQISIRPDGHLPQGGTLPSLIDWGDAEHPALKLAETGCRLQRLEIGHPDPPLIERQLNAIGFSGPVVVIAGEHPVLRAHIDTPAGLKTLC